MGVAGGILLAIVPLTGVATLAVIHKLSKSSDLKWLIVVPALAPLLMAGFGVWAVSKGGAR